MKKQEQRVNGAGSPWLLVGQALNQSRVWVTLRVEYLSVLCEWHYHRGLISKILGKRGAASVPAPGCDGVEKCGCCRAKRGCCCRDDGRGHGGLWSCSQAAGKAQKEDDFNMKQWLFPGVEVCFAGSFYYEVLKLHWQLLRSTASFFLKCGSDVGGSGGGAQGPGCVNLCFLRISGQNPGIIL